MKKIALLFVFIFSLTMVYSADFAPKTHIEESYQVENSQLILPLQFTGKQKEMTAFWINMLIAAIGVYSIYGFAAGIVSVGITYFVTNGNKKAFKLAILGCIIGMLLGAAIWLGVH